MGKLERKNLKILRGCLNRKTTLGFDKKAQLRVEEKK